MVFACCVPTCSKSNKDVQMHSFPKDEQVFKLWLEAIGRDDLKEKPIDKVRKSYRVCNNHFGPEADYVGSRRKSTIRVDAVPTLFLNNPNVAVERQPEEFDSGEGRNSFILITPQDEADLYMTTSTAGPVILPMDDPMISGKDTFLTLAQEEEGDFHKLLPPPVPLSLIPQVDDTGTLSEIKQLDNSPQKQDETQTMPDNRETCCICAEKCVYIQNITECVFFGISCLEKLQVCCPNQQWDKMFNICNGCVEKLDVAYDFVQLCLKTEAYRNELLRIRQLKEKSIETPKDFTCYQCNKSFRLKRILGVHMTKVHIRPKSKRTRKEVESLEVTAEELEAKFSDENLKSATEDAEALEDETIGQESKDSDYELDNGYDDSLSDSSNKDKKLAKRLKNSKFKGPHKCPYCQMEFLRSNRYVHHVRSKHTFEKPFKCNLCDAKYYSQHNLNIHMRKHRNEKPFVCATCGKCFISSNDLWQHNKIHNNVRQYGCDECERCFKTHSNLRTHKLQMHQDPGTWKFVCPVCGKKFPLNNNLIKHMRRHSGIKDFMCHLCDKRFVEKVDLQTHLVSHSNERHYKCTVCFKAYKKRETLRRHMKTEHNIGNFVVKKPEKKLKCHLCPKIFAFNNKLQRHILTHTGEKPVKCELCEKRFRDNYDRKTHLRQVHNVEPSAEEIREFE